MAAKRTTTPTSTGEGESLGLGPVKDDNKTTTTRKPEEQAKAAKAEADAKSQAEVDAAKADEAAKASAQPGADEDGFGGDAPEQASEYVPEPAAPGQPVEEGYVEIVREPKDEKEAALTDPSGKVTERKKRASAKKDDSKDVLKELDLDKLPVAANVGQIQAIIKPYAGRAVLEISLVGWIGDAPVKIPAEDAGDIAAAVEELKVLLKA